MLPRHCRLHILRLAPLIHNATSTVPFKEYYTPKKQFTLCYPWLEALYLWYVRTECHVMGFVWKLVFWPLNDQHLVA